PLNFNSNFRMSDSRVGAVGTFPGEAPTYFFVRLPAASIRYAVGYANTLYLFAMPSVPMRTGYLIPRLIAAASILFADPDWTATAQICKPRGPYFSCNSFRWGISLIQGSHHVAQKIRSTAFPCALESVTVFPAISRNVNSGARPV